MARLRIEHGTVLSVDPPRQTLADGLVVVEDAHIAYVGPMSGPAREREDDVIDAAGCIVMPGLVNAHTHVSMTLLRGYADDMVLDDWLTKMIWPAEMKLRRDDCYWGAMLGIVEMLRAGVTTFSDMYHYPEAVADAILESGIRGCVSGVLLGILPNAEDMLREAVAFTGDLKARANPRLVAMLAPHAPYTCPDDLLVRTAQAAAELGVRLHIHLSETEKEVADSIDQHGRTPVEHLADLGFLDVPTIACHCVHLSESDLALLAERQVGIAHCPTSNMKLASGFAPIPALLAAGACVGVGTDGAASNNNLDMLEEMKIGAIIAKGYSGDPRVVSAPEMLAMATRGSAAALGLADEIGTLTPGKRADIIVVDTRRPHLQPPHNVFSHVVYSARADDVRDVIVDGAVLLRGRRLAGCDEDEVMARAAECAARLVTG